jgi:ankyrin repeat protein
MKERSWLFDRASCRIDKNTVRVIMQINPVRQQLFEAVFSGDLISVQRLVAENPMSSRWSSPEQVPLITISVQEGHFEIVQFLVENKARLNWMSPAGNETLYSLAKRLEHIAIAEYLRPLMDEDLQRVADAKAENNQISGESSSFSDECGMFDAISNDDYPLIQRMLAEGANVNMRFEDDITPLIAATSAGNFEIVKLLVQAGADVNALDADFESALLIAYDKKLDEISDYLEPITSQEVRLLISDQQS